MKKIVETIIVALVLVLICSMALGETYTEITSGYNGDMTTEVDIVDGKITDIRVVDDHESSPVKKRAFPIIISRILDAGTPAVDSVTGATFCSYSIKSAVVAAMKEAGLEAPEITFRNPEPEGKVEREDETVGLLIVGAGPSGQCAAIAAVEAGMDPADVLVIEKLDITGGNGKFDMVLFNHTNTKAQEEAGVVYTADDLYNARVKGGAWDSEARLRAEADMTATMDAWYRGMGIELNYFWENTSHMAEADAYAGEELLDGIEARVKEYGIEVRTGTKAEDLIMENGALTGVSVSHGNETYNIKADAVIIATGGFCQNPELLAEYTAEGTSLLTSSNQIGATGDMVKPFEKNGFQLGHMDKTVVFPWMISKGRELTGERVAPQEHEYIMVNREGKRFTNETVTYGLSRGMAVYNQEGHSCYMLFDQSMVDFSFRIGKHVKEGLGVQADTWEELAEKLGVNAENLVAEVEKYNKEATEGITDELRESVPTRAFDAVGPYYALEIESAIHMTKGGVVCNENAECLDTNGNVIPGAYASGEVTDTSANFSASLIFGRIAGEQAAKYVLAK